jgi:hypothetical protein
VSSTYCLQRGSPTPHLLLFVPQYPDFVEGRVWALRYLDRLREHLFDSWLAMLIPCKVSMHFHGQPVAGARKRCTQPAIGPMSQMNPLYIRMEHSGCSKIGFSPRSVISAKVKLALR